MIPPFRSITKEHVDNNVAVRKMLTERGVIPENLPLCGPLPSL
jgi:hypothetical protein